MMTPGPTTRRRGFTLIELLVALAIFTTIMAGVTIMFNSVVRITKQGYQNQQAFETVRGALSVIEEDLTRSFGSRATGHKHTFYGTPFGFTFIGLVPSEDSDEFNLARITYVIYGGDEHDELETIFDATIDDLNENDTEDERKRHVYSLLRFIEPGQDDLDSYPIDWASGLQGTENPEGQLSAILTASLDRAFSETICGSDRLTMTPEEISNDPCLNGVLNAKKQELWMRMLAGDPSLPRFWDDGPGIPTVRLGDPLNLHDPLDYVIAENIMHIERNLDVDDVALAIPFDPDDTRSYTPLDLTNRFVAGNPNSFIDPDGNDMALIELRDNTVYNTTPAALFIENMFDEHSRNVLPSKTYFFAYREYDAEIERFDENNNFVHKVTSGGILLDGNGNTEVRETEITARDFAYWNDTRNLEHNTFTNELIILSGSGGPTLEIENEDRSVLPDIVDPAMPESIMIELAFFYPSPFPSAPDFQRVFTHRVNIPGAYRRKSESLLTKNLRREE